MDEDKVRHVAAAIRREMQKLLGDYFVQQEQIIEFDAYDDLDKALIAHARLNAIAWLRQSWTSDAATTDDRLERVARAAIAAMEETG